jgi:hypothetical protein
MCFFYAIIELGGESMIEHIYIKNYKAFNRENVPLNKKTLLIGTHQTGKTTIFEALDLFFHHRLNHQYIRDNKIDVVVEIHVNEERYRKVFSPPSYELNFKKCIGNMMDINAIQYLYIPSTIDTAKLLNDILTINMTSHVSSQEQTNIHKVSDYIDGILGNNNYNLFRAVSIYQMDIKHPPQFSKEELNRILSNITYQNVILGIDNIELNFDPREIDSMTKYMYQTIFSTAEKTLLKNDQYSVSALYKGSKVDDFDTIKKRLYPSFEKIYLLVEGKYDVAWFETALKLLQLENKYLVIPCGGSGNITFIEEQLHKEGHQTITITDGDTHKENALQKEVIELYADPAYINHRFHTNFDKLPTRKHTFFKHFSVKDDVVKAVLSRWAKKFLTVDHEFVQEVRTILKED